MKINTYLFFNGNCGEALKYYEQALGGRIESVHHFAGSPAAEQVPADWQDKILHARLNVDGEIILVSDAPPGRYSAPQGFSVSISLSDAAHGERIFNALCAGGQVTMPYQQTFWAERFGMCTDRFGINWMVNCEAAAQAGA